MMKGIILAGGHGTRLYPMTSITSKHLLPIYDKPLIYYPLSTLMLAGIKDILLITTPESADSYKKLLGDGSDLGIKIRYKIQDNPNGLAEAFIVGEEFINEGTDHNVCLILGDNFFYGQGLVSYLEEGTQVKKGAIIFGCPVKHPEQFGVITVDKNNNVIEIEEKPQNPKSNLAVPGLYFFDKTVIEKAKKVKPSKRGELEITSIIDMYLKEKQLKAILIGRGLAWMDTGTPEGMKSASDLVANIQSSQGFYIACIEEIAYNKGFISYEQLMKLGKKFSKSSYGQYILKLKKKE